MSFMVFTIMTTKDDDTKKKKKKDDSDDDSDDVRPLLTFNGRLAKKCSDCKQWSWLLSVLTVTAIYVFDAAMILRVLKYIRMVV